ncbi:alkylation response protein AidB-like acyl-CoA dehydrogenase [Paenibacillus endophyticus]|uniref:Alkylation response protein AidB-like acyl-CoA dehydrogenase n=1 Tax=Paenibacillus endophyticus TaxID=1294268 RepID=A0A7W5CC08_9BACL|nr:acyl-CoA dehydrogenase family protein [Paenibacillus endophyticus]MBB3154910.1 alkylation response protein AidB-like acyl-CoA dehydrogenase [Paenibacillus endophyticus]
MGRLIDQYIRSAEEQHLADQTAELAARFAARAEKHDRAGSFPHDNFADLLEDGYLKLTVPAEYGGNELSLHELVTQQERLAYGDGSTALAVGWHLGQMLHLRTTRKWPEPLFAELCRDVVSKGAMINTFASEAGSGSPSRGGKPETTAIRTEGGWLISGRKTFSTLSPILDRFVVTAYMPEEEATADFLVFKNENVTVHETWDTIGMRGTGSHDVVLNEVFAADEHRLAGKGIDDGGGWLLHIPACYIGIALAARDFAISFAQSYRPNHLQGPIAELPTVQQSIGQMEIELRTARSLLYEAAGRWDREPANRPHLRPELGLAKYVATNHAVKIVDIAMRIVGGSSLSRSLPLERYYRDVRAGLHNPPMDNTVLQTLAAGALNEQR